MAANDYYNTHTTQSHGQAPYYQNNGFQSYNPHSHQTGQSPVSPYEAPFENSYPLGGMDTHGLDSQTTLGQDARYYGQGASQTSFRDDIPLREHPAVPAKDDEPTDHVYDASPNIMGEGGRPPRRNKNGFFRTPLAKVPWVVYTLTLIQISVFIAEIAKNGMQLGTLRGSNANLNSCVDKITHRNPPFVQSYDRSITMGPHQHGSQIRSVHAQRRRYSRQHCRDILGVSEYNRLERPGLLSR